MDGREAAAEVAGYLADCRKFPQLRRKYHPTEDGAVSVIWCPGDEELVREAFRAAMGRE
jgi:hypothetical protein